MSITSKRLSEVVSYCPETGNFVSLVSRGNVCKGKLLGKQRSDGYVRVSIDGESYYAHHLAYLYVYGYKPNLIDHIDGDRGNNKISNLREASLTINARNSKKKKNGSSRFKGMTEKNGKWVVMINTGNRNLKYIGCFSDEVHAAYMYDIASIEHHGEYGRRNFLPFVI